MPSVILYKFCNKILSLDKLTHYKQGRKFNPNNVPWMGDLVQPWSNWGNTNLIIILQISEYFGDLEKHNFLYISLKYPCVSYTDANFGIFFVGNLNCHVLSKKLSCNFLIQLHCLGNCAQNWLFGQFCKSGFYLIFSTNLPQIPLQIFQMVWNFGKIQMS